MSALTVYDKGGAAAGEVEFPDGLLVMKKGTQALHDAVVAEQAARRSGTASSLSKGHVSGSGRKPWRQKGTGRARAGYKQSPVWRGGSAAFGPHPRDFSVKLNRKTAQLAFRRAFSEKLAAGCVKVVDSLHMDAPRTRAFTDLMKALDVPAPALFLSATPERNVRLSARNVAGVELAAAESVSVYQLLRYPRIVLDREGLAVLRRRFEAGSRRTRCAAAAPDDPKPNEPVQGGTAAAQGEDES